MHSYVLTCVIHLGACSFWGNLYDLNSFNNLESLLVARPTNSTFVRKIGRKITPLFPKILRNLFSRIFSLRYSLNYSNHKDFPKKNKRLNVLHT